MVHIFYLENSRDIHRRRRRCRTENKWIQFGMGMLQLCGEKNMLFEFTQDYFQPYTIHIHTRKSWGSITCSLLDLCSLWETFFYDEIYIHTSSLHTSRRKWCVYFSGFKFHFYFRHAFSSLFGNANANASVDETPINIIEKNVPQKLQKVIIGGLADMLERSKRKSKTNYGFLENDRHSTSTLAAPSEPVAIKKIERTYGRIAHNWMTVMVMAMCVSVEFSFFPFSFSFSFIWQINTNASHIIHFYNELHFIEMSNTLHRLHVGEEEKRKFIST